MKTKKAEEEVAKRSSYHHGDLRRALLRAAREEIAAHGAQGLALASLARRAGVSQPAPYRHFADREALLAAVATEGFEEFTAAVVEAQRAGDERGALLRMALAYVRFAEANIELYRLMFASRVVPEAAQGSTLAAAANGGFSPLHEVIAARHGGKHEKRKAIAMWAQLHGLVMLKADGFIEEPLDVALKDLEL